MDKNILFRAELKEAFLSSSHRPHPPSHPPSTSYYPTTSYGPPSAHSLSSSPPYPNPSSHPSPPPASIAEAVSFDQMACRKNDQICLFAFLGILLTIFLFIIDYDVELGQFVNDYECFLVKCLISLTTGILVFLQMRFYHILANIENNKWGFPNIWSGFFDTSLLLKSSAEIGISLLHTPPFLPSYYHHFGLLMILRGFLLLRFMKYHSQVFKLRHKIISENPYLKRHRPIFGWKLIGKMYFYTHPVTSLIVTYSIILLTAAFCIMIAERTLNENLTNYGNALYMTIVSCASIGYGDITPRSYLGKFIVCVFALIGIVTLSLLVSVGDRALRMRSVELYSVEYVGFLKLKKEKEMTSLLYIQCVWKLRKIMKENGKKWPYKPEEAAELNILIQRKVAMLIGNIKSASRTMHHYRIRELALATFLDDKEVGGKNEEEEKEGEEEDDEEEEGEEIKRTKETLKKTYVVNKLKAAAKIK